jgi:NitT/TauT family transport system substrate-binding protein
MNQALTRTRREFLRTVAATAAGLALAGCGASAAPASPAPASTAAPASAAASAAPASKPAASAAASKPAASPAGSTPGLAGQRPLIVAYPTINAANMPLWMGDAIHAFSDRGLKIDMRFISGDIAVKALVAKEVDVLLQAATGFVTADLNGGLDLVLIGSGYNHSQGALAVGPAIQSAADLKGKFVGTDKEGTSTDFQVRSLLKRLGLTPNDVTFRVLGSSNIIAEGLMSGQVQAGHSSPPFTFQLEAKGFHLLTDLYTTPYQSVGPIVPRSRIDELAPSLIPFLEGYRDGVAAYYSQRDLALKQMEQWTKESNQDTLTKTYQFYVDKTPFQKDLQPTAEGVQSLLDFLAPSFPAAKAAKPEQFIDTRLLSRLSKPGS